MVKIQCSPTTIGEERMKGTEDSHYAAFISYSRSADGIFAPALASALRRFGVPWYPFRSLQIFLDKSDLAANPALWASICRGLERSGNLVVLASPEAAQSYWVRREIDWWLANRSSDTLLIGLTSGEIEWDRDTHDFNWSRTNAIPNNLSKRFMEEPLYIDFRTSKQNGKLTLGDKLFQNVIADLAAPIHGKKKSELVGEDRRNRRRAALAISAAICTLIFLGFFGFRQRIESQERQKAEFAQKLAAQSELLRAKNPDKLPQSLLLAIESLHRFPSSEAQQALMHGLELLPHQISSVSNAAEIVAVAFSPDGAKFATGADDGAAIWETETGKQLRWLPHPNKVSGVVFSRHWLATACSDGIVRIWDLDSSKDPILWIHGIGEPDTIRDITVSPDGKLLATASSDNVIRIWDLGKQQEVQHWMPMKHLSSISFGPNSDQLAVGAGTFGKPSEVLSENVLSIWDIRQRKEIRRMGLPRAIQSIAFSPDGSAIAVGGLDGNIRMLDANTLQEGHRFELSGAAVRKVSFSPVGDYLAAGALDHTARIWNWREQREVALITHDDVVNGVAFSADGLRLVTASSDHTAAVWESGKTHEIRTLPVSETNIEKNGLLAAILLQGLQEKIDQSAWEPFNGYAIGGVPGLRTEKKAMTSPDGRYTALISGSEVRIMDASSLTIKDSLKHPAGIMTMTFCADGQQVATASRDGMVRVWLINPASELKKLPLSGLVHALECHPNGRYLLMGSDKGVFLWDIKKNREVLQIPQSGKNRSLQLSPDALNIATAEESGFVTVWSITPDPDGTTLSAANNILSNLFNFVTFSSGVRDLAKQPILSGALKPDQKTKYLEFSPTGRYLLTFDSDPTSFQDDIAHVWLWRADDLEQTACIRLLNNFTATEWKSYFPGEVPGKTCRNLNEP
jgi:WD40 repeat protein